MTLNNVNLLDNQCVAISMLYSDEYDGISRNLVLSASNRYDVYWTPNNVVDDYTNDHAWINNYYFNNIELKLIIGQCYQIYDRLYINANKSLLTFIKKCKVYYKNRLNYYKNIHNIFKRQLIANY